jgi:hypothetical protein
MFIPDLGSRSKSTKRGGEQNFCPTIFCSQKYYKIVNNFSSEQIKEKFFAKTLRIIVLIIVLFTQKFVIKLSKIWAWDPGSGKTYSESWIPDPGSKRHRIPDPDPQY